MLESDSNDRLFHQPTQCYKVVRLKASENVTVGDGALSSARNSLLLQLYRIPLSAWSRGQHGTLCCYSCTEYLYLHGLEVSAEPSVATGVPNTFSCMVSRSAQNPLLLQVYRIPSAAWPRSQCGTLYCYRYTKYLH